MATATDQPRTTPEIRHEEWCRPTADPILGMREQVRIEQYLYLADDPKSGRSKATHRITRCMECAQERVEEL